MKRRKNIKKLLVHDRSLAVLRENATRWVHDRIENKEPLWFYQFKQWMHHDLDFEIKDINSQKGRMQREYNRLKKIYKKKYKGYQGRW